jgi:enoyl-CoA hydratase/carnithine racemase
MAEDVVIVDVTDRVATMTLNRPEVRNALNAELRDAITRVALELDADASVDAIILTGADPAFCAGLDLKELATGENDLSRSTGDAGQRRLPIPNTRKPVIGAINGVAVTGGLELALNCDFLVASDRARFADTHNRVGVQPGWGMTVLLPQAVGLRRAKEMSATGNYVDADTALMWGLVNHVVPHDELLPFCRQLGADMVSNDSAGIQHMFVTYDECSETSAAEAWLVESRNARRWLDEGGGRQEEIAKRREAIQARGRSQTS